MRHSATAVAACFVLLMVLPAAGHAQQAPAVLRDKASGEVVWQGDAYYDLSGPETERVARALVAPLVDKMGQSVVREPLQFD